MLVFQTQISGADSPIASSIPKLNLVTAPVIRVSIRFYVMDNELVVKYPRGSRGPTEATPIFDQPFI